MLEPKHHHKNEKKNSLNQEWKMTSRTQSVHNAWTNEQKADLKWLWRHMVLTKILTKQKNHYSNLISKIIKMCEQIFKKHTRTSPDVKSEDFLFTKQKPRTRKNYVWSGKTISKRNQIEKTENQCQNAAFEQKISSKKWKFVLKKLGQQWTMNGLGKPFKKMRSKKLKNSKNRSQICAFEQKKRLARKRIFVQTHSLSI